MNAYRFHFIIALTFFLVILFFNLLIYQLAINIYNVLIVSIITIVYFIINEELIYGIITGSRGVKVICLFILLLLFYNIFDLLYHIIYRKLPEYNIILFSYEVAPDNIQFNKNISRSCVTVSLISLSVSSYKFFRKRRFQDKSVIDDLEYRIMLSRVNPHFFKSIFTSALCKSIFGQGHAVLQILIKLTDIIAFILYKDDKNDQLIALQEEWKQVENFLNILKWNYGDSKVKVFQDRQFSSTIKIPSLLVLSAIENANKYTDWSEDEPFHIKVQHHPDVIQICVSNIFHPRERIKKPSTKFGLYAIKKRIFRYNKNYNVVFKEEENIFSIDIKIKNND